MFELAAWLAGLGVSFAANAPYLAETSSAWWLGIAFGISLYPGVFILGIVLPRLSLNFAGGATIGGGLSAGGALFQQEWPFLAGSLITLAVGCFTAHLQRMRVDG